MKTEEEMRVELLEEIDGLCQSLWEKRFHARDEYKKIVEPRLHLGNHDLERLRDELRILRGMSPKAIMYA